MAHIHIEPGQHDHTVSAYIIHMGGPEARLLLHRHKKLGKWLQPGGHIELHENPWQAVEHELLEETGYRLNQLQVLQPRGVITGFAGAHPLPLAYGTHAYADESHYHTDLAYGFTTNELPAGIPGEGESPVLRWVTLAEFQAIPAIDMPRHTRETGKAILSAPEKWVAQKTY